MGIVINLSELSWNQAYMLGEFSRSGQIVVKGTGKRSLKIDCLGISVSELRKCLYPVGA